MEECNKCGTELEYDTDGELICEECEDKELDELEKKGESFVSKFNQEEK